MRHEQRHISQFESNICPTIDSMIFSFLNYLSLRLLVRKLNNLTFQGLAPVESLMVLRMEGALKYDKKIGN